MRVAVMLTGQPRFLAQGAWWMRNRVFPAHYQNLKIDYYCYFWDDGSTDLEQRIVKAYAPVKYKIASYDEVILNFKNKITTYNTANPQYAELAELHIHENILYNTPHVTKWGVNFWGQYFATGGITELVGDLSGQYDIVIKTRSDAIFNPLSESHWGSCFKNMYANPVFRDKMFAPWMHIEHGIPHMGDFAFISKPDLFYQFSKNIHNNCFDLATKDKSLFYELNVANHPHVAHWVWNKISNYSRSNWLSFAVVWPTPFNITLLRQENNIQTVRYDELLRQFNNYENNNK